MNRVTFISACAALFLGGCSNADEDASIPARHANESGSPRHVAQETAISTAPGIEQVANEIPDYQDMAGETTREMQSQTEAAASDFKE